MATNDFLPFATGGAANVLTQAQWAALGALLNGFQSGIADSKSINKAFRQSSIMSAVLAQFIVDKTGANATDDGTTATLLANLKNAVTGRTLTIITATGNFTVPAGVYWLKYRAWGGGGGSGGVGSTGNGGAGGGGSSGSVEGYLAVTPGQVIACTIGNGGTAGGNGGAGGSGGTTIVGSGGPQATGGGGGSPNAVSGGSGGAAGVGSGGTLNLGGGAGAAGSPGSGAGGYGGTPCGGGGAGSGGGTGAGGPGALPGGGAGGSGGTVIGPGAAGARGQINFEY